MQYLGGEKMREIIEEYGEIILAIVGATGVLGITIALMWGRFAQGVVLFAGGL